jgi:hypothetical protein
VDTETSAALSVTSEPALPCYVYAAGCGAKTKVVACVKHRAVALPLTARSGARVVAVNVFLNGRLIRHLSGHKLRRVSLKGLPAKGRYVIKLVTRNSDHSGRIIRHHEVACG